MNGPAAWQRSTPGSVRLSRRRPQVSRSTFRRPSAVAQKLDELGCTDIATLAVAGERWLAAVPLMRVLAVAMLFRAVVVLTGQLLDAVGHPALTMRLNAVRLAALLVLLPPLAAWGGAQGIAQGVLLANAGAALLASRYSARVFSS